MRSECKEERPEAAVQSVSGDGSRSKVRKEGSRMVDLQQVGVNTPSLGEYQCDARA